jgi:putative MFS transporter
MRNNKIGVEMSVAELSSLPDAGAILARLERLPVTRTMVWTRVVVGSATFFDGFTTLAIAYALPVLAPQWGLNLGEIGYVISAGYVGQMVGALLFSWLADRYGRLPVLGATIVVYAVMSIFCIFAWSALSMALFRFVQGIGTGGEVPVASAYINEFASAKRRGRFFLLYEVLFVVGLAFAGVLGFLLVPVLGWQSLFWIGALPAVLTLPMRFMLPESPRWLVSNGRLPQADALVSRLEAEARAAGKTLLPPEAAPAVPVSPSGRSRELFSPFYRRRTFMLWTLWLSSYLVNNGLVTWLPTLYRSVFHLPLQTSLGYGFAANGFGVITSVLCALYIDKVGRRRWYIIAFFLGTIPLITLFFLGATSAIQVAIFATCVYGIIQTITFSLYLYSGELYPTRIRAVGAGTGSACLRIGSALGPIFVGEIMGSFGISYVFIFFAGVLAFGGVVCLLFGVETRRRMLEELSP